MISTPQEAYEAQRAHFSKPGAQLAKMLSVRWEYVDVEPIESSNSPTVCKYLTENGDQCAVGCLLTKKQYDELNISAFEGSSLCAPLWNALVRGNILVGPEVVEGLEGESEPKPDLYQWLSDTQLLHDTDAVNAAHLVDLLDQEAEYWGLEVKENTDHRRNPTRQAR